MAVEEVVLRSAVAGAPLKSYAALAGANVMPSRVPVDVITEGGSAPPLSIGIVTATAASLRFHGSLWYAVVDVLPLLITTPAVDAAAAVRFIVYESPPRDWLLSSQLPNPSPLVVSGRWDRRDTREGSIITQQERTNERRRASGGAN